MHDKAKQKKRWARMYEQLFYDFMENCVKCHKKGKSIIVRAKSRWPNYDDFTSDNVLVYWINGLVFFLYGFCVCVLEPEMSFQNTWRIQLYAFAIYCYRYYRISMSTLFPFATFRSFFEYTSIIRCLQCIHTIYVHLTDLSLLNV